MEVSSPIDIDWHFDDFSFGDDHNVVSYQNQQNPDEEKYMGKDDVNHGLKD